MSVRLSKLISLLGTLNDVDARAALRNFHQIAYGNGRITVKSSSAKSKVAGTRYGENKKKRAARVAKRRQQRSARRVNRR